MTTIRNQLSRRWVARSIILVVIVALLVPAAVSAATEEPTKLQPGNITEAANGTTVISVQGFGRVAKSSRLCLW
jgi:hypothetical protein